MGLEIVLVLEGEIDVGGPEMVEWGGYGRFVISRQEGKRGDGGRGYGLGRWGSGNKYRAGPRQDPI